MKIFLPLSYLPPVKYFHYENKTAFGEARKNHLIPKDDFTLCNTKRCFPVIV